MNRLMNSAMMPSPGVYHLRQVDRDAFVDLLRGESFESYIGYPETAKFLERISGVIVPLSRAQTTLADGDKMLIVRLKYRVQSPSDKGKFVPSDDDFEFFVAVYHKGG